MDTTSNPPSDPSTPTRTKWLLAALGAVLLLGTTVGIVSAQEGDESNGDGTAEQQGPSEEDRAAFEAYRDCLAENGVERPEDGERPDRDSITEEQREAFRAAREACADEAPLAGHRPGGPRGFGHGPCGFGPGGPEGGDEAPAGFPGGGPGALQGA